MPGSTKAAVELLSLIGITVLESIVVDELCEFRGREKLANIKKPDGTEITVTPLVSTQLSVDGLRGRRFLQRNTCHELP